MMAPRRSATDLRAAEQPGAGTSPEASPVGWRLVEALVGKDAQALRDLLSDEIDFRAVTPSGSWQASAPDEVVQVMLGTWFRPDRRVEDVLGLQVDETLPVARVGYRFAVRRPDGRFVVEQQALYAAATLACRRCGSAAPASTPSPVTGPDAESAASGRHGQHETCAVGVARGESSALLLTAHG